MSSEKRGFVTNQSDSTASKKLFPIGDKRLKKLLMLGASPSVLGFLVALFAPKDILLLLPVLQVGVDVMTAYLPMMAERVAASRIPQILAVTYLISWVCLPVQFILFFYSITRCTDISGAIARLRERGYGKLKILLTFYGCFFMAVFYYLAIGSHDFHFFGIDPTNTRAGVALVGGLGFLIMSFSLAFSLRMTFTQNSDWEN